MGRVRPQRYSWHLSRSAADHGGAGPDHLDHWRGGIDPAATDLLSATRGFDLVPYYPLVLTAFLLLTSIIIPERWRRFWSWMTSTPGR
ncbi:fluoroquinolones export permease Rv2686c/MT2760 domain protein [Mycobacteroides abscessus MAB_030201_1061]|nr:fluoroquinolones export permease Rv2686c/MT2760 domain protein [Mycobacteroides abscessus MAB_030201_1061]